MTIQAEQNIARELETAERLAETLRASLAAAKGLQAVLADIHQMSQELPYWQAEVNGADRLYGVLKHLQKATALPDWEAELEGVHKLYEAQQDLR
jgi:hypothetical protein